MKVKDLKIGDEVYITSLLTAPHKGHEEKLKKKRKVTVKKIVWNGGFFFEPTIYEEDFFAERFGDKFELCPRFEDEAYAIAVTMEEKEK